MGVTLLPTHSCSEEMQKEVGVRHWVHAENGAAATGGLKVMGGTGNDTGAAGGATGATGGATGTAAGGPSHVPEVQPNSQAEARTHFPSYTTPLFWMT